MRDLILEKNEKVIITVRGMSCASCSARIEKTISGLEGVHFAKVNFANETATVEFDPLQITVDRFPKEIQKLGFEVPTTRQVFLVGGMTWASCVSRVEKNISSLAGVSDIKVNLATEQATIEYFPSLISFDDLKESLGNAGYQLFFTNHDFWRTV